MEAPVLTTARLLLRPFGPDDAPPVQELAGDWEVASTTASIPHPYPPGEALRWIGTHARGVAEKRLLNLAITLAGDGELVGAVGLQIEPSQRRAELGYWIGRPYWGRGYATGAAEALLGYAFEHLDLYRIHAHHMARNPASGRVLEKIGMRHEGCLRQHFRRWERYEDLVLYGALRSERIQDENDQATKRVSE